MSYNIKGNSISMTRGDTLYCEIEIFEQNGVIIYEPLNDDTIQFAVKKKSTDQEPLILKYIPVDTMILKLDPEDTKNLDFGSYFYDIQITKKNGDVDTFITKSPFIIMEEIG